MCFVENLKRKQRTQGQKGAFPAPNCQFFQIHGSKLKLDPSGDCGQASVVRITHCVLFFCVSKHSLNGLLAHRVNAFRIFCFSDTLHSIQIGLPDVSGQEFLTFLICPTFRFAGAFAAVLWSAAVDSFSILVRTISRTQTDETEHTIRDFLTNVAKYDTVEDFSRNVLHNMQRTSSRNGILKAEACREVALVCQKHGINTLRDFNDYADKAALDKDIKSVRGQSSGIMLKYLYMLTGDENRVKPDRHIVRFIKETCALQKLTDDDVQVIMVRTVEMLKPEYPNITVRFLDSLIWETQRR